MRQSPASFAIVPPEPPRYRRRRFGGTLREIISIPPTQVFGLIERIPNLGFFLDWFALVLLLACVLVFSWSALSARLEAQRAQAEPPAGPGRKDEKRGGDATAAL
jgi:hypothetical protein